MAPGLDADLQAVAARKTGVHGCLVADQQLGVITAFGGMDFEREFQD